MSREIVSMIDESSWKGKVERERERERESIPWSEFALDFFNGLWGFLAEEGKEMCLLWNLGRWRLVDKGGLVDAVSYQSLTFESNSHHLEW
jgi:hypothetical protein